MESEPVHFIISDAEWALNSANLEEHCHVMPIIGAVLCTRQNVAGDSILEDFRAVPAVIEVAHADILDWKLAHPEYFPVEE